MTIHIIPTNDIKEHEESPDCWCRPQLDDSGDEEIWIHNALDRRELYEDKEQ